MSEQWEWHGAPLLVRRPPESALNHVQALLRDTGVAAETVLAGVRAGSVLVLADVTLPPAAPPLAAVALRCHDDEAELEAVGVVRVLRRRGLGRRLLTGTLTLLRSQGIRRVTAVSDIGTPTAALLADVGFSLDSDATTPPYRWTKWL